MAPAALCSADHPGSCRRLPTEVDFGRFALRIPELCPVSSETRRCLAGSLQVSVVVFPVGPLHEEPADLFDSGGESCHAAIMEDVSRVPSREIVEATHGLMDRPGRRFLALDGLAPAHKRVFPP